MIGSYDHIIVVINFFFVTVMTTLFICINYSPLLCIMRLLRTSLYYENIKKFLVSIKNATHPLL